MALRDKLEAHPLLTAFLAMFSLLATCGVAFFVFVFHSEDASKFAARDAAAKAAQGIIHDPFCRLVYAYVHPPKGTVETPWSNQVASAWGEIGSLAGCPQGIKPKG